MFLLGALYLLLAFLDGAITYEVLQRYGLDVELNVITRKYGVGNLVKGIALGIGIPTAVILCLTHFLHPMVLGCLVIARMGFLVKQLETHWPILGPKPRQPYGSL